MVTVSRDRIIATLRKHRMAQASIKNIDLRIEELEAVLEGFNAVRYDRESVQGGDINSEETRRCNIIDQLTELRHNRIGVQADIDYVDRALDELDDDERLVIDRMYINRVDDPCSTLCAELGVSQRTIYRIRDNALDNFALLTFGAAVA